MRDAHNQITSKRDSNGIESNVRCSLRRPTKINFDETHGLQPMSSLCPVLSGLVWHTNCTHKWSARGALLSCDRLSISLFRFGVAALAKNLLLECVSDHCTHARWLIHSKLISIPILRCDNCDNFTPRNCLIYFQRTHNKCRVSCVVCRVHCSFVVTHNNCNQFENMRIAQPYAPTPGIHRRPSWNSYVFAKTENIVLPRLRQPAIRHRHHHHLHHIANRRSKEKTKRIRWPAVLNSSELGCVGRVFRSSQLNYETRWNGKSSRWRGKWANKFLWIHFSLSLHLDKSTRDAARQWNCGWRGTAVWTAQRLEIAISHFSLVFNEFVELVARYAVAMDVRIRVRTYLSAHQMHITTTTTANRPVWNAFLFAEISRAISFS